MTPIGSEPLFVSTARGRISHQKEIGQRRSASVRIFTGLATWSSGSSTRLSTVGVWQRATTSLRSTTSHSSSLHPYAYGCALISQRPSATLADLFMLLFAANPFFAARASLRRWSSDEFEDGLTHGGQCRSRRWPVDSFFPALPF